MEILKSDLESFSSVNRLNIVNSISGVKQPCLIGSISKEGIENLGLFSSIIHLGADPALLGFVLRPHKEVRRDTFENILETGYYTINHVHQSILVNSHYTSAKIETEESEFKRCNLTSEYIADFKAPFVVESIVKIGMKFLEQVPIKHNGASIIIGQIERIEVPKSLIEPNGLIDFDAAQNVVVSGLSKYYKIEKVMDLPYARVREIPRF